MATPAPAAAPFTTVTHWTWELLKWRGATLSVSKRTAYLNYVSIPRRARRPFEIAAYVEPGVAFPWGFPRAGEYRAFVQVRRAGRVCTGVFSIQVQ